MINEQEQIVRMPRLIGNGAHIFVPREWIGNRVVLIRTKGGIRERILDVIDEHLESIEGVFLYGSHARGEAVEDSDIDLLVITNKKIKMKAEGFEIICLERDSIEKAIKLEPLIIYSALGEAKPIINSALLEELREKYKPDIEEFREYIEDTKRIININRELIDKEDKESKDLAVPYSLILRLRGLYIIKCIIEGKIYSHDSFKKWILNNVKDIDYNSIYKAYRALKNNKKEKVKIKVYELSKLLELLEIEAIKLEGEIYGKKRKKA